jgi:TonB family protein
MKPIIAILVLTVAVSLDVVAQDIRSKVGPPSGTSFTNIIDPDKSIYGAQWGSSEDEFISKFGYPTGYIRLNGAETAMLYGKFHAFIFTASKLSGVHITSIEPMFTWKLSQVLPLSPFDRKVRWQLSNGIRPGMNLAEIKKILRESLKAARLQTYYFNSVKAGIEMDFYRLDSLGDKDEAYKLNSIYIRQVNSEAAQKAPVSARPVQTQIPEATRPCTAEVAKWWQEVRAAAKEVVDAMQHRDQAIRVWFEAQPLHSRRWPDNDDVLPQKERDKLKAELAVAREKYRLLLAEVQVKSYRAPIEDSTPIILYTAAPTYTEKASKKKTKGTVNLHVELRSDGTIGHINVMRALGDGLDEQAIKAAYHTIFLPLVKNGMFVTILQAMQAEFDISRDARFL